MSILYYFYPNKLREVYDEFAEHSDIGVVDNRFDVVNESGDILLEASPLISSVVILAGRTPWGFVTGSPSSGISVLRRVLTSIKIRKSDFVFRPIISI